MKIGFVIYGSLDTLSGGYLYDRNLVEYLRARGDIVEIISLPWRNYAAHLTDNLHFRLPNSNVIARRANFPTKQSPNYKGYDIIIQDELNHPSLIAANAGKHPYPIISLVHHLRCSELRSKWQNTMYRLIEKRYLNSVDGVIFNSETTKSMVHGLMVNGKSSIVAYPPTDRFGDAISEDEIRERAKDNELRILFLGNIIYRKGLHILLEALSRVGRDTISSYELDVVGSLDSEPRYAKAMQAKVKVLGLTSTVFFHGALDNEPLIEILKQANVLVVPSSYEGFGIVYLEGMGFGLPAIGTTAGAAGEIISDGVDGFLVQPENAESLAGRLKVLNEKRDVLVRMSLAARERYLRQPKWEETAESIRRFLQGMVERY